MTSLQNSTSKLSDEAKRKRAERWAKYSAKNRDKLNAKQRARHAADPDRQKNASLKHLYGITLEQRDEMIAAQDGRCAVCRTDTPTERGWVVDHCHNSGAVRGILCHPCNTALGLFKDNTDALSRAISYLKAHNG